MDWQDLLKSFLVAAAFFGCWKGLSLLIGKEIARRRKRLRYIWPTAMVAWSWFMLWATSFPSSSHWMGSSLDILLVIFFAVNLPAAVVGNAVLVLLIDWPGFAKGFTASAIVWLLWYGIICAWEWWKARSAPIVTPRIGN